MVDTRGHWKHGKMLKLQCGGAAEFLPNRIQNSKIHSANICTEQNSEKILQAFLNSQQNSVS